MPALAVLGMHRSYTSLAARWLAECGIDMGEAVLEAGIGNEDGHFEDTDFLAFHVKALAENYLPSNGMANWGGQRFYPARYGALRIEGALEREVRAILESKQSAMASFGWKEPRTCLFLPFYRAALDPYALILFRPFEEVVSSLLERERRVHEQTGHKGWRRLYYWATQSRADAWFAQLRSDYLAAWIYYNQCLLQHIEVTGPDRYMVHDLASMTANDSAIIERLQQWGFACEMKSFGSLKQATKRREIEGFSQDQLHRAQEVTERFAELIGR